MIARKPLGLLTALLLAACAGNPGPGQPGYAFNLNGEYEGDFFTDAQIPATLVLETARGGVVTGSVEIPMLNIVARLEGTLVGNELTYTVGYNNPQSGCAGEANGLSIVSEGGASLEGDLEIAECDRTMTGTMLFKR